MQTQAIPRTTSIDDTADDHRGAISGIRSRSFCTACGVALLPAAAFCASCGIRSTGGPRGYADVVRRPVAARAYQNADGRSEAARSAPASITIDLDQLRPVVPVVGLVAGFLAGEWVAGQQLVSAALAIAGCFLGYAIALRAPGSSFDVALHQAWANVGSSVRVLVDPLRTARTGSPATARPAPVAATTLPSVGVTAVAATGPEWPSVRSTSAVTYAQAAKVGPTRTRISKVAVVRAIAGTVVIGALVLPWATVSGFNVASFSLNGLGQGSYSVSAGGYGISGGAPGLSDVGRYLPSGLGSLVSILQLLPLLAALASVALLVVLAVAHRQPARGMRVGTVATIAGLVAIVAAGAWFVVISILDGIVSVASPGLGLGLVFTAGVALTASGLFSRR